MINVWDVIGDTFVCLAHIMNHGDYETGVAVVVRVASMRVSVAFRFMQKTVTRSISGG